jgi:hypothetical protein
MGTGDRRVTFGVARTWRTAGRSVIRGAVGLAKQVAEADLDLAGAHPGDRGFELGEDLALLSGRPAQGSVPRPARGSVPPARRPVNGPA